MVGLRDLRAPWTGLTKARRAGVGGGERWQTEADGGAVAGTGLEEGDDTARGLERGHGEVGGRPRSSLKV
jgi:hypothetical protein